jgi:hypothetical protein
MLYSNRKLLSNRLCKGCFLQQTLVGMQYFAHTGNIESICPDMSIVTAYWAASVLEGVVFSANIMDQRHRVRLEKYLSDVRHFKVPRTKHTWWRS